MALLTRNLPRFISDPAIAIIGQTCYTSLVENLNINDMECIKLSISKALGLGIVAGGSVVKIPQVLLITKARSARGLSLSAYILETLGYSFTLAYSARNHFPFSTYGENLFLTIQNLAVTLLIILYPTSPTDPSGYNVIGVTAASLISAVLALSLVAVPHSLLALLQISTLPISLFSKIPQIVQNARARSTGQLSSVAVASQVLGCVARLFTTATEVGDPIVLWGFGLALLLNAVIAVQMWLYWGSDELPSHVAEKTRVEGTVPVAWASA
ncbi:hypothetical protein BS47DRAFT_1312338 [Hydnum rufescens UP504]|uniref:Mannose-P-dolichol utilization defect 1 protein homolog n=1 Tax=Hydnum rufescens UP504 TaxID=1448309 RepID=A0A9P6B8Z1_9AGAM|nr:hypothetical protein BS47DRAFT_1312338 [Hydnum rufescens UP504]